MKRIVLAPLAALGLLLVLEGHAFAQLSPYQRPTVSPYLNLLRRGSSPAINYYGLVRPEFQTQAALQQLQQNSLQTDRSLNQLQQQQQQGIPATGHRTGFMTQGRYFMTQGGGVGSGSRAINQVQPPVAPPRLSGIPITGGQYSASRPGAYVPLAPGPR